MEQMPYYNPEQIMGTVQQMAEQSADPMKRMLAQMALSKMQESGNSQSIRQSPASTASPKMVQDIQQLIKMNREMLASLRDTEAKLAALRDRNSYVAASLGACACWGFDDTCPTCFGQGKPGALEVNTDHFKELILPFFQKIVQTPDESADQE